MKLSNYEIEQRLADLQPLLDHVDIVGYAAAKNSRKLQAEFEEYDNFRSDLVKKYGKPEVDAKGNETGNISISPDSENFDKFLAELTPLSKIEHEVDIFKVPEQDVIGLISGKEILAIDWMLEGNDAES